MTWQPDDIPKEVQEHYEHEAEKRGLFSSPPLSCSADDVRKIRHCIGLLNSMVRGGERHSDTSARMTVEALEALERMEQPNVKGETQT